MVEYVHPLRLRPLAQALAAVLTLLVLGASAAAQVNPDGQPDGQDPVKPVMEVDEATDTIAFSMNESNGMPLVEFVKWAQEVTGKRFTYTANELQNGGAQGNTVSFLGTFRIKRDRFEEDFFSFFQTMLYIKGFACILRGEGAAELVEIVQMQGL